jgi:hypothetical protein
MPRASSHRAGLERSIESGTQGKLTSPRFLVSILVGVSVLALLPMYSDEFHGVTSILVGWEVGVALYLSLAFWMTKAATSRRSTTNLWLRMTASPSWC